MKKSAPSTSGILTIAAIFGLVALVIAYALLNFGGMTSFVIGLIVAIITAIILWMGWGEPEAGTGQGDSMAPSTSAPKSAPSAATSSATSTATKTADAAAKPAPVAPSEKTPEPTAKSVEPVAEKTVELAVEKAPEPAEVAEVTSEAKTPAKKVAKPTAKKAAPKKPSATKTAAKEKPAAKTATKEKPAAKAAPKRAPVAADGKPELLSKPRGGAGDDLKQIKGVGPKMETLLNSMGVWHFDQVAGWRKKEVEWVDNNLEGFKGRVSRDEWVKQAKVLAKGGTTEFSKKVKKGSVY